MIVDNSTHTAQKPVTIYAKQEHQRQEAEQRHHGIAANKISVLALTTTSYGMQLSNEWRDAYIRHQQQSHQQSPSDHDTVSSSETPSSSPSFSASASGVQFISIHIIDRWLLRRLFSSSMISNLKKIIPAEYHARTGVTVSSPDEFTQAISNLRSMYYTDDIYESSDTRGYMNVRSRMFGYILVLDEEGRIRWMTIGKPANQEQCHYFVSLIQQLSQTKDVKNYSQIHSPSSSSGRKQLKIKQ